MNSEALCVGARVDVCACADRLAGACALVYVCVRAQDRTRVPGARPQSFLLPPPGGGRAPTLTSCPRSPAQPPSSLPTHSAPHPSPALDVLQRNYGVGRGRLGAHLGLRTSPPSSRSLHPRPACAQPVLSLCAQAELGAPADAE